ncbi:uncharacterized protein LACBIDRAFT_325148 [Laccaria bicolor S238N-H82]|uniref:Predicted protein n=1 Tax=Laccaria bicolor (strain S238N-H82 / ATCC MYA-4686) TaxID=486041 RepID=B0D401_LACBS|nr:uncharacterized protein LACBIDRAFT_325148 [Laccaria bicolor S238N-H82]EDR10491.1 predicted protein [Laccaria bicolor S238N-H82]|eukprot:XP_001878941.1 predicted protein [Laccaria bicolor S238N-H82]
MPQSRFTHESNAGWALRQVNCVGYTPEAHRQKLRQVVGPLSKNHEWIDSLEYVEDDLPVMQKFIPKVIHEILYQHSSPNRAFSEPERSPEHDGRPPVKPTTPVVYHFYPTELNREYFDNSRKHLETRCRAHPVIPLSMQAKEKIHKVPTQYRRNLECSSFEPSMDDSYSEVP